MKLVYIIFFKQTKVAGSLKVPWSPLTDLVTEKTNIRNLGPKIWFIFNV